MTSGSSSSTWFRMGVDVKADGWGWGANVGAAPKLGCVTGSDYVHTSVNSLLSLGMS